MKTIAKLGALSIFAVFFLFSCKDDVQNQLKSSASETDLLESINVLNEQTFGTSGTRGERVSLYDQIEGIAKAVDAIYKELASKFNFTEDQQDIFAAVCSIEEMMRLDSMLQSQPVRLTINTNRTPQQLCDDAVITVNGVTDSSGYYHNLMILQSMGLIDTDKGRLLLATYDTLQNNTVSNAVFIASSQTIHNSSTLDAFVTTIKTNNPSDSLQTSILRDYVEHLVQYEGTGVNLKQYTTNLIRAIDINGGTLFTREEIEDLKSAIVVGYGSHCLWRAEDVELED